MVPSFPQPLIEFPLFISEVQITPPCFTSKIIVEGAS